MRHAAAHAPEQLELLGAHDFVLQPDLVHDEAEPAGQIREQVQVSRGDRFVVELSADEDEAEEFVFPAQRHGELRGESRQLLARLALAALRRAGQAVFAEVQPRLSLRLEIREDGRRHLEFRHARERLFGVNARDHERAEIVVAQDDPVVLEVEDADEQLVQTREERVEIAVPHDRFRENANAILILEVVAEDPALPFLHAGAAEEPWKDARADDDADDEDAERNPQRNEAERIRENEGDDEQQREGGDGEKKDADELCSDPAQADLHVEEMMLEQAVGDDHAVKHRRDAAVGIHGNLRARIIDEAVQRQRVVRAEHGEHGLRDDQRREPRTIHPRK